MNEQIEYIFDQALEEFKAENKHVTIVDPVPLQRDFVEKFAKLIVAECINKVRSRQMFSIEDEHNIHHAFDLLVYDLESYFGVEK